MQWACRYNTRAVKLTHLNDMQPCLIQSVLIMFDYVWKVSTARARKVYNILKPLIMNGSWKAEWYLWLFLAFQDPFQQFYTLNSLTEWNESELVKQNCDLSLPGWRFAVLEDILVFLSGLPPALLPWTILSAKLSRPVSACCIIVCSLLKRKSRSLWKLQALPVHRRGVRKKQFAF